MNIKQVLRRNRMALLALDGVVSVGTGYKVTNGEKTPELSIIVSVEAKQSPLVLRAADVIPSQIGGIKTDVIAIGKQHALENIDKMRPCPGGLTIGHEDITAGTLGCVVWQQGKKMILSNCHVLANSNDAALGDPILQPGPHDGGVAIDQIGRLHSYVPIVFSEDGGDIPIPPELPTECNIANAITGYFNATAILLKRKTRLRAMVPNEGAVVQADKVNLIDAALCEPNDPADVLEEIIDIGRIVGSDIAILDMPLKKSGRTTGYTEDVVLQVDVTVKVQYGEGRVALFEDQIMAGPMSAGGDSGSAVLNDENRIVGLLYAGSDEVTIINRIENVFRLLDCTL